MQSYCRTMYLPARRVVVRWAIVLVVLAVLAALPSLARARPAPGRDSESAAALVARIEASRNTPYSGYAESHGTLAVPDVAQLGDLPSLLGDTTKMRVWTAPNAPGKVSRVDVLDDLGETDTYTVAATGGRFPPGSLVWESQEQRVTVITGMPPIRTPRAGDLLPSALGQRLAGGVVGATVTRISSHRVAGRDAQGIRIHPGGASTVDHVDIWADSATGVPLQVQVFPLGTTRPALSTAFLSYDPHAPAASVLQFTFPPKAKFRQVNATDLQGLLGRLRDFPYPSSLGGLAATATFARSGSRIATYGTALQTVAVARLDPGDAAKFARAIEVSAVPVTDIPGAQADSVTTPLVNALLVRDGFRAFVLAGTVPLATLRTAYDQLATIRPFRGRPPGQPA